MKGLVEKVYLQKYTRYRRQIPYRILYSFTYHDKVYYHKSRLVWEKPDLKKGDLITVYVNNLGKSTVYNCNKAVWYLASIFRKNTARSVVYRRAASKNAEYEKCNSIRCMEIQRLLIGQIKKLGKSIFIILFNFVYVFENPVHVQMQLN